MAKSLTAFTGFAGRRGIAIFIGGKSVWRENVFVERPWQPVNYEEVHLKAYAGAGEAKASLARYFTHHHTM